MMQDLYRRLMEFTGDGVYRYAFDDGRILLANQGLVDILDLDCKPEELTGTYLREVLIYTDKEGSVRHALEEKGEIRGFEYHFKTLKRDDRWVIHDSLLVVDPVTKQRIVEAIVKDITARKQAEEELQKYRLHLEELIEERTADLARSNTDLAQFAYVASHDLQEPLRKVASFTQLLADRYADKLDADAKEFIAYAVDGAHRMQGLINDLLAYSRVGTQGKSLVSVDCNAILEYVIANLEMAIQESGAEVTHERLPTVMGDELQLVQLFQNLIANAIKFRGAAPPQVHVSAARQEKEWIFRVRDNGIGIDPQYFGRLFVIFQRLHTRSEYPGSGIGLAISKKVVERHGGRIWVESQPGRGSTFCFSIPER